MYRPRSSTALPGGIGVLFILGSIWLAAGLAQPGGAQWPVFHALMAVDRILEGSASRVALEVAGVTMLTGWLAGFFRRLKRANILVGLACGCLWAAFLPVDAQLERVGWVAPPLFMPSLPDFRQVSWPVVFALAGGAAPAIALVGALQSLSIAKALRDPGEPYRPAREMLGQALTNLWSGFFMGAPASNSFNKSSVMYIFGGGGALAHLFAVAATALMVYGLADAVAYVPMSALGAALILAGLAMIAPGRYAHHFRRGRVAAGMFCLPAVLVVILDIQSALFIGVAVSILAHFVHFSRGGIDWQLGNGPLARRGIRRLLLRLQRPPRKPGARGICRNRRKRRRQVAGARLARCPPGIARPPGAGLAPPHRPGRRAGPFVGQRGATGGTPPAAGGPPLPLSCASLSNRATDNNQPALPTARHTTGPAPIGARHRIPIERNIVPAVDLNEAGLLVGDPYSSLYPGSE